MFLVLTTLLLCESCSLGHHIKIVSCPMIWNETCDSRFAKFYLYTRESPGGEFVLFLDDGTNNLTSSKYKPNIGSVVIIHGSADSYKSDALQKIKKEYLLREEVNVWFMDWSVLTPPPSVICYPMSVFNVEYVGKCLTHFIRALGSPDSGLHVVGFSLGGHVPALAAPTLKPYLIPRITGLDPALPMFIGFDHQKRLSPDDGKFVDVIHTNSFFQGNYQPMGHVDFFVNGGIKQPGCGNIFESISCSHIRNPIYYAESINSKVGFWGWSCDKLCHAFNGKCNMSEPYHLMGDRVSNSSRGLIYVKTNDKPPFALGKPKN